MNNKKRMVVIADIHCGHEFGLTPPDWWARDDTTHPDITKAGKFQRELWNFYTTTIESLKPIDILIVNGDAIEGKGERSGGIELITPDRNVQIRMAKEAIDFTEAKAVRILYGTRYHVGKEEDFEANLKDTISADDVLVQGHAFLNINGCGIDIKHKVTRSIVPHGRMTSIARERLWNVIWHSEHERQPKANVLIRSHVHYFNYCGGEGWVGITTPALCYNSHYGIRECSGLVDVGLIYFDFESEGAHTWQPILAQFSDLRVQPESL